MRDEKKMFYKLMRCTRKCGLEGIVENKERLITVENNEVSEPTGEEIDDVLNKLKNSKSPAANRITAV